MSVYRVTLQGIRIDALGPHQRIFVLDDVDALRWLMQVSLEIVLQQSWPRADSTSRYGWCAIRTWCDGIDISEEGEDE